jgi:hypothetical protein
LIEHGICSITSHSTAFLSSTLSTANTVLTVFGAPISISQTGLQSSQ